MSEPELAPTPKNNEWWWAHRKGSTLEQPMQITLGRHARAWTANGYEFNLTAVKLLRPLTDEERVAVTGPE